MLLSLHGPEVGRAERAVEQDVLLRVEEAVGLVPEDTQPRSTLLPKMERRGPILSVPVGHRAPITELHLPSMQGRSRAGLTSPRILGVVELMLQRVQPELLELWGPEALRLTRLEMLGLLEPLVLAETEEQGSQA